MFTLEELLQRSRTEQRPLIRPCIVIAARTPEQQANLREVVQAVIREHRDVLVALKNH